MTNLLPVFILTLLVSSCTFKIPDQANFKKGTEEEIEQVFAQQKIKVNEWTANPIAITNMDNATIIQDINCIIQNPDGLPQEQAKRQKIGVDIAKILHKNLENSSSYNGISVNFVYSKNYIIASTKDRVSFRFNMRNLE